MRISTFPLACALVMVVLGVSCSRTETPPPASAPVDTRAQDEAAIRANEIDWLKAVQAKDQEKSLSVYADDAVAIWPGAPMASGKEAIAKAWTDMMATPGFAITWATTKVDVAKSGDLAYEIGDYALTTKNKRGKPQTVKAVYIVVWGKQADGSWKVLVDAPTTTLQ